MTVLAIVYLVGASTVIAGGLAGATPERGWSVILFGTMLVGVALAIVALA